MLKNGDVSAAWSYHDDTKHSVASVQSNRHFLDWDNKPLPFKVYRDAESLSLAEEALVSEGGGPGALESIAGQGAEAHASLSVESLTRLLWLSAGITHTKDLGGGERYYFRAAACTGALYHIDVYVVCGDIPGLAAGVYQFAPQEFALRRLRRGDYRAQLVAATAGESHVAQAPATLVLASTYWRNSWKYQDRAYRHCFWDAGTLLANLLAAASSEALAAQLVCGFVDGEVEHLLGLDAQREGAVAMIAVGDQAHAVGSARVSLEGLNVETLPLSRHELRYPTIIDMHDASKLETPDDVATWRASPAIVSRTTEPLPIDVNDTIATVIRRRGSSRRFQRASIDRAQLEVLLRAADAPICGDFAGPHHDLYLIVNAVEGVAPGTYYFDRRTRDVVLLRSGQYRAEAGYLGLGQELPADAAVNLYALADLRPILHRFGNRGYRVAQLEAAIAGGRIYLAAYAMRLGATGLTFFDDDVTRFFSPHADGKSVLFLTAVGHARRRATPS